MEVAKTIKNLAAIEKNTTFAQNFIFHSPN